MSPEELAALGARRGDGESLGSWLQAGPWGRRVWSRFDALGCHTPAEDAYCQACRLFELGRWRWYSREAWSDPRQVVCATHAVPLLRAREAPDRKWNVDYSRSQRSQFRALEAWLTTWLQHSPRRADGRLSVRAKGLEDHLLWALTRGGPATAPVLVMQWRLWAEQWPVPARPQHVTYQIGQLARQVDRLAVVASVWKVQRQLLGCECFEWPALWVKATTYRRLEHYLDAYAPRALSLLPRTFQVDAHWGYPR